MVWYENMNRTTPYIKNFRGMNMWYDYNNGKHRDMARVRFTYLEYWIKRMCKHEGNYRLVGSFLMLPFVHFLYKTYGRFRPVSEKEESIYSGAQYVASLGRNQYGFETRVSKSFEHALGVVLGSEILGNILNQDSDPLRAEELSDEDAGLAGDFSEEDVLSLRKEAGHACHVGIVYLRPDLHYLNEKPNDVLSPYRVIGENIPKVHKSHDHGHGHGNEGHGHHH